MTRVLRIVRHIAFALAALILITLFTALVIIQTDWFRNYARKKLIVAIENATGGATEIGSVQFDVWHLHARLTNLVIHGTEPPTTPPFLTVAAIGLYVRPFTSGRILGISFLGGDRPEVNIMVFADGRTNIPTPKPSPPPRRTPLATVVDLAVKHFELRNGLMSYNLRMRPLEVQANNLRAQLWYRLAKQTYEGRISLDPIYILNGRTQPVTASVTLPVTLERDAIRVRHARIATPDSAIQIDASLEDWRHPVLFGHVHGNVTLATLKNAGALPIEASRRELQRAVSLDLNARGPYDNLQVTSFRVALGQSRLAGTGVIKPAQGSGMVNFSGQLALSELARLVRTEAKPGGTLELRGEAAMEAHRRYRISSHVTGQNLAFEQGKVRIRQANLSTDVQMTPGRLALNRLRVDALGAEFDGEAAFENFVRYQLNGNIRNLDLQQVLRAVRQRFPYDGVISGSVQANGELKAPLARKLEARTQLAIAPGRRGIPLRGRLQAEYSGARDDLALRNSYLALPHTRLTLAGSVRQRLDVSLVTRDLSDLPATGSAVTLNGGQATFTGAVTGLLHAPLVSGTLAANRFQVRGRPFDALHADVAASPTAAAVRNGSVMGGPMQASFSGSVGLRSWSPAPDEALNVDATIQGGDVADLMALAGQPNQNFSGSLFANLHVAGTVGNPRGSAMIHVAYGTLLGEPFDHVDVQANLSDQLVTIPSATLTAGSARVDFAAEFQHPRDSFRTGTIHARLRTNSIDLGQVRTLKQQSPKTAGTMQASAEATGVLTPTAFQLTSMQADASARGLRFQGQPFGDLQAQVRTSGRTVSLNVASDFAGSVIRVRSNTQLAPGYPTTADVQVSGLAIERVLAAANRGDIPAKGTLSATAHMHGSLQNPEGDATLDLSNAVLANEPIDRVRARVQLLAQRIDVPQFELAAGPARVDLTGRFDHPAGRFDTGTLQFRMTSTGLDLARIRNVQNLRPGLSGSVAIRADGSATVRTAAPRILLTGLEANLTATNLAASGTSLGGLNLAAHTTGGNRLDFKLTSNLVESSIEATGNAQLSGDYPISAQVNFRNLCWTNLAPLLGTSTGAPGSFDATAEGKISLSGPMLRPEQIRGSLDLSELAVATLPAPEIGKPVTIKNEGPVTATLDRGVVRIDRFHLTGPHTDVTAAGTLSLQGQTMNTTVSANVDLALLENFNRDITSSGSVKLTAAVRGTLSDPLMTGQIELHGASVNYASLPVGVGNATGIVLLRGNRATFQNMTAELGGGRLVLTGFTTLGSNPQLGLHATAERVRMRVQEGLSIIAAADIRITGTLARSTASGTATLEQLNYAPKQDLGSILQRTAPPVETVATPSPLLDNMKLDIRVRSSPATRVQSSLAEGLQVDADLRMTGTAGRPALLGRINLNQGRLTFFGSTYTINSGVISFSNPTAIQPILNLSLETQAKGVDVTLNVTGPIDNMKLTYTSNPPLQFQEILGLLSTGAVPTSDPTLLANQPTPSTQTMQQVGESAIVSQAIASPVASRLQRVFGVSQLRIDPTFVGTSQLPAAQVTLQQQVSQRLTFTYISAPEVPNSTLIRAEFMLNQRWSATAVRDQNGIVSVNLVYKRQFR